MPSRSRLGMPGAELACAGGLLFVGVFVVAYGLTYPLVSNGVVGPGLMPTIAGTALASVAAILIVQALRSTPTGAADPPAGTGGAGLRLGDFAEDEGETSGQPRTVAGILGLLALAVLLAPTVGLIPMLALLVFVCVRVFERQSLLAAGIMTIGSTLLSWLLFVWFFEVPVPTGSLWRALG